MFEVVICAISFPDEFGNFVDSFLEEIERVLGGAIEREVRVRGMDVENDGK